MALRRPNLREKGAKVLSQSTHQKPFAKDIYNVGQVCKLTPTVAAIRRSTVLFCDVRGGATPPYDNLTTTTCPLCLLYRRLLGSLRRPISFTLRTATLSTTLAGHCSSVVSISQAPLKPPSTAPHTSARASGKLQSKAASLLSADPSISTMALPTSTLPAWPAGVSICSDFPSPGRH